MQHMGDSAGLRLKAGYDDKKIYTSFVFYNQRFSNAGQKSYISDGASEAESRSDGQAYGIADQTNQDSLDRQHGMLIIYLSLYNSHFQVYKSALITARAPQIYIYRYRVIFSIGTKLLEKFLFIFHICWAQTLESGSIDSGNLFAVLNVEKDSRTTAKH